MFWIIVGVVVVVAFVGGLFWLSRLGGKGSSQDTSDAAPGNGTGLFT